MCLVLKTSLLKCAWVGYPYVSNDLWIVNWRWPWLTSSFTPGSMFGDHAFNLKNNSLTSKERKKLLWQQRNVWVSLLLYNLIANSIKNLCNNWNNCHVSNFTIEFDWRSNYSQKSMFFWRQPMNNWKKNRFYRSLSFTVTKQGRLGESLEWMPWSIMDGSWTEKGIRASNSSLHPSFGTILQWYSANQAASSSLASWMTRTSGWLPRWSIHMGSSLWFIISVCVRFQQFLRKAISAQKLVLDSVSKC